MSTVHILSLDDDPDFGLLLKAKLKAPQFKVKLCNSAPEFLQEAKATTYDLFIIDYHLGQFVPNGAAVLEVVRQHLKMTTPVIMLSHLDDYKGIQACLELGADDFVTKPLDEILLKAKIQSLLRPDGQDETLHLGRVPAPKSAVNLSATSQIIEVNEIGMKVLAPFFVRKGALIRMRSEIFKAMNAPESLALTVTGSELCRDGRYQMLLEFDPDDRALIAAVRAWIG